ncbi:hypothetical protein BHM03_00013301 [Ensete ventricosum]|nr:hypothetical protein BHM03_00013301 [Ensete ventricosum]
MVGATVVARSCSGGNREVQHKGAAARQEAAMSGGGNWRQVATGKEGTTKSKGRRGCNCSDSKEVAVGKKGEEERWQRRLGSTGGSKNDSFGSVGRVNKAKGVIKRRAWLGGSNNNVAVRGNVAAKEAAVSTFGVDDGVVVVDDSSHNSGWQQRQGDSRGLQQQRCCCARVGYDQGSLMELSKQWLASDRKRLRMAQLLQRRAWLRQRRLRRREEEAEETMARVWRPLAVHCQGLVDGSGREAREEGSTVGSAGSDGQLGNSRARRREKGWKDVAAAMVEEEREMVAGG